MLSASDTPVSDDAITSGVSDWGPVVSMVMGSPDEARETFPAVSVRVEETFHVPSVSVGSVQFVADPMT
jgi:hypothetical protein